MESLQEFRASTPSKPAQRLKKKSVINEEQLLEEKWSTILKFLDIMKNKIKTNAKHTQHVSAFWNRIISCQFSALPSYLRCSEAVQFICQISLNLHFTFTLRKKGNLLKTSEQCDFYLLSMQSTLRDDQLNFANNTITISFSLENYIM